MKIVLLCLLMVLFINSFIFAESFGYVPIPINLNIFNNLINNGPTPYLLNNNERLIAQKFNFEQELEMRLFELHALGRCV